MRGHFTVLAVLALPACVAAAEDWPGLPPDCWPGPRVVHAASEDDDWKKKIAITKRPSGKPGTGQVSPNGGYTFVVEDEGTAAPRVTVYAEKDHITDLVFSGLKGLSEVKWVNEKLLFVRVWWGRIKGTDLLYDVEREAIIHSETFTDGGIAHEQYVASCPLLGCECIKKKE